MKKADLPKHIEKRTSRLIIRQYKLSDYHAWKAAFFTVPPSKSRFDRIAGRHSKELTLAKFKSILKYQNQLREADRYYDFAVFEKKTWRLIGFVCLMEIMRKRFQSAILGYVLFSQYWNKGYGTEMVCGCMDIAFKTLRLHRIEAGIDPDNMPSIRLAKKVGMRKECIRKKCLFTPENKWADFAIYVLTEEDWGVRPRKPKLDKKSKARY